MLAPAVRSPAVNREGAASYRNVGPHQCIVLVLIVSVGLIGCGGGSSSSGGGRQAGPSSGNGIANASASPASYTTAAGVRVTQTVRTHLVTGTTCRELASQSRGLRAHVHYTIQWSFSGAPRTDISIVYTYPLWEPGGMPPRALVNEWNRYIAALQVHEQGHRDIGISIANRIIRSGSDSAADEIFRNTAQQDELYDADTGHGSSQGARLLCG